MKAKHLLSILCGICLAAPAIYATTVNMDSSANYTEGWTDGSNGGGGFAAWNIAYDAGDDGYVGFGILSSTNAELNMGNAFGYTAMGNGADISLTRNFTTALEDGDVFELDLGMNYDCGSDDGSKGFVLYTADDREIVVVNQGNSSSITVNGNTALTNYGTATMYWTFTQNSATEITVYATGRGGESEKHTEVIELSQEGYIAGIRFYANGITNDTYSALRAVYFDNLTLEQGASSDTNFNYSTEYGHVIITDIAKDTSGALIIPSTLGGYPVTEIARTAGSYCTNITSLSFVDGSIVTNMGVNTFQGCTALQSAILPDGLTAIPDSLFCGCTNLGSVTIPAGVTNIGTSAFAECRALSSINLPDGLTSLGESVFLNCRSLTTLKIPDGITAIPGQLCYECRALSNLILPDRIINIGYRAFYNCQSLTSLGIPESVILVDAAAFEGCSSLTSLVFDGTLERIDDEAFYDCVELSSIYFNGGVDILGDAVFGQSASLAALYFKCDVPTLDFGEDLFIGSGSATVYYIANPSSWGSTFGGAPVAVWAPSIAAMAESGGSLQITMEWEGEGTAYLQACTNLAGAEWSNVSTNVVSDGSCVLTDPNGYASDHCFYRILLP